MKTLRRMSVVTILSLTLAATVFAGHIETPSVVSPPTPPRTATSTTTTSSGITTSVMFMILGLIYR
jgi:hypothetical protein